ncbi:MAG: UDP-N-acetylmuramate dehydrogenase [Pseudobutyrivibrio sp.]|nr:UDP-N-acetylmuramate dehydrogenase [Pseudobutyrivibrio sp.]
MHNYTDLIEKLQKDFSDLQVYENEPMSGHTTFKIGGPADIYVEPSISQVVPLIKLLQKNAVPFMVIGNGSNLLVSDDGIEGVVISLAKPAAAIEIEGTTIRAEAGAMLSSVANQAAEVGLTGLEFASGIPGSIGGGVYMNAGAYGGELKDVLVSVKVLTDDYRIVEYKPDELDLSYRHSSLMENGGIVLEATIKLEQGDAKEIKARIEDIRNQRVSKQPLNYSSAGSTFKRPKGYFAGKLIDDAGLRGYTVGGAQVSEKHCGFVINKNNAKCSDVLKLMAEVDDIVFAQFGVHLTPEVRIVGRNIN